MALLKKKKPTTNFERAVGGFTLHFVSGDGTEEKMPKSLFLKASNNVEDAINDVCLEEYALNAEVAKENNTVPEKVVVYFRAEYFEVNEQKEVKVSLSKKPLFPTPAPDIAPVTPAAVADGAQ